MKNRTVRLALFLGILIAAQMTVYGQIGSTKFDIGSPANTSLQVGGDASGAVQNTVNEITGKVSFSAPLVGISAGPISYSLSLGYSGEAGFRTGKQLNKYSPTSTVGVGWSLPISKIVVDNKETTTRDDDDFYIVDGSTNTKLICFNKESTYWEFQLERHANWKITYNLLVDTWTVIKEDGYTYAFGDGTSAEKVSTWGNWIGDSNQNPTGSQAIIWNLASITDQWGNYLDFTYESILGRQNTSQTLHKHTEASYLKEIVSSYGEKIKLNYGFKNLEEYYEPHRERAEPDAYQERYEKKFLLNVELYNSNNQVTTSYDLGYLITGNPDKKRYLTSITTVHHKNGQSFSLPPKQFEYHLSGTFEGGLKKVTYAKGGTATYNYQNKYLFQNGTNRYLTPANIPSGYVFHSSMVKDNYVIMAVKTTNPVSGGKYRFKFFRYTWDGQNWDSNEFTFPHLIAADDPNTFYDNFHAVFEDNFYGFAYDKGTQADLYLFHKEKNDKTWKYYTHTNLPIANEDPTFMSGSDFVAMASKRDGRMYTYVWNGATWNFKQIAQGAGQYYYGVANNFILSLDIDYDDKYYIHYLDAEKKWQTKNWSSFAGSRIGPIQLPSKLFPDNSIAGFIAANNHEFFLRWDTNYNLIAVDNVLGGYDDNHNIQPFGNSMFTIVWPTRNVPKKAARFNGVSWSVNSFSSATNEGANFGLDFITYFEHNSKSFMYKDYSPNYHTWSTVNVNAGFPGLNNVGEYSHAINRDFFVAGNKIFKRTLLGPPAFPTTLIGTLQYDNYTTYTNGLDHTFVREYEYGGAFKKGTLLSMDKETGALNSTNLNYQSNIPVSYMISNPKFGGWTPFISPRTVWVRDGFDWSPSPFNRYLYRIINDKVNQPIYDIVVDNIVTDDQNGPTRKTQYTYNLPNPTSDNGSTYYGEVTVENKGYGSGNIGKVKKIFDTGANDIQMAGLTLETHVLDANNSLKSKITNTWQKRLKGAFNGSTQVDQSHYITLNNKREELFFGSSKLENFTSYTYNSYGQVISTTTTNSKGQFEREDLIYAHQQYSFMFTKNMLSEVYQRTTQLNSQIVNVNQNHWISSGGKAYLNKKYSGPNTSKLRLQSQISNIDSNGNVLETNNQSGIYSSVLNGYDNAYEVASISNARHSDVVSQLDVTYTQLQNLSTESLKTELMKLYDRLPNAMISLTFYDDDGRVINVVDSRKEETYTFYDMHGRIDYITDGYGRVLERKEYNYGN